MTLQYGIIIIIRKKKAPQFLALIIQIFLFYISGISFQNIFSPLSTCAGKFQSHFLGSEIYLGTATGATCPSSLQTYAPEYPFLSVFPFAHNHKY